MFTKNNLPIRVKRNMYVCVHRHACICVPVCVFSHMEKKYKDVWITFIK